MTEAYVDSQDKSLVHCGQFPLSMGNEVECGVVLKPDKRVLKKAILPSDKVIVYSESPKVIRAVFRKKNVMIKFDKSIDEVEKDEEIDCGQIFDEESVQLLGLLF